MLTTDYRNIFYCNRLQRLLASFSEKNALNVLLSTRLRAFYPCGLASSLFARFRCKTIFEISCLYFILFGMLGTSSAQILKNEFRFKYQHYEDNNGVIIRQPMVRISQKIWNTTAVNAHMLIDGVTAASRKVNYVLKDTTNLATYNGIKNKNNLQILSPDAVTSASQKETRIQWGAGIIHQWPNTQASLSFTKSDENDYFSKSGSIDIRQDVFNKNTNLSINYTRFNDKYLPDTTLFYNTFSPYTFVYSPRDKSYSIVEVDEKLGGPRNVNNVTLGITQTLSRRTLASLSWGIIDSRGFLGRPYYFVTVEDTLVSTVNPQSKGGIMYAESYPAKRLSNAVVLRLRQHYPSFIKQGSTQFEYRWYDDNWGLQSNTYTVLVNQYLEKFLYVQLRYRYYEQGAVNFYRDRYTQRDLQQLSYFTVDTRLADFISQLIQVKIVFLVKDFFKPNTKNVFAFFPTRYDIDLQYYLRSTHQDAEIRRRRYELYDEKGLRGLIVRSGFVFEY